MVLPFQTVTPIAFWAPLNIGPLGSPRGASVYDVHKKKGEEVSNKTKFADKQYSPFLLL